MLSVIVAIRSWTAGDCLEAALTSGFVAVVDSGVAGCSGAVTSITGDGTVFANSASTGAVTLSLAGAGKYTVLGNGTSTNGTAPTYQSSPGVEGIDFHGSTSGSCLINMGASNGTLQICGASSIGITNGVFSEYNGNALADMGVASILGTLDEVGVSTANSGTAQNVLASTPNAGHFRLFYYADESTACTTVSTGALTISVGWTDATNARASAGQTLTPGTVTTGTSSYLSNSVDFWSATASPVTVTATYTACSVGTWKYDLHAYVEEIK
jgi:hypothetical protein